MRAEGRQVSAWRRKAFELFPESRVIVEQAPSVHRLFFQLLLDVQEAYRAIPPKSDLIDRTYAFAAWCFAPRQNPKLRGAAVASFYEHLADFGPARRDLPNRLTREQFTEMAPAFRLVLDDREFQRFRVEFLATREQVERGAPAV
jgi:hypothetical protein